MHFEIGSAFCAMPWKRAVIEFLETGPPRGI